jgi:RHS repeat-associated protein
VESVKDAATLVDFTYTLDPVGNPTQIVRTGSAPGTTTHAYDVRDRLTEVCFQTSCPGGSDPFVRWTYDAVGNRLTEARPAGTTNYTYNDADQLTQAGSTTYSYDQNGNETAAGSRTFASDVANRVISTTSGGTTTYTYDGDGNRLQITSGGQTTRLLWDENHSLPQLALERDGGGALLRRYVYGDRRVSMTTAGAAFYYHHDGLGSVANITASNGAPQWSYAYEPFGAARTATQDDPSAPTNPLKFAGELEDATNLYYLRARQYDPVSGRFLQVDPVSVDETAPAISTYSYVANRPTVLVDPSGKTGQASDVAPAKADGVVSPVIEGPVLGARSRCGTELGAAILRHRNIFIYSPHRSGVISDLCTRGVINWKVKRGLLRAAGYFKLGIYVMKTGHSPGTYHELGRAVDLANFTSSNMALATRFMRWLNTNRKMLANFVELIGPNESLVYPQGGYSRATLNGHKNHVHIAW